MPERGVGCAAWWLTMESIAFWLGAGGALGVGVIAVLAKYPGEPGLPYELRTPMLDSAEGEGGPQGEQQFDLTADWVRRSK